MCYGPKEKASARKKRLGTLKSLSNSGPVREKVKDKGEIKDLYPQYDKDTSGSFKEFNKVKIKAVT